MSFLSPKLIERYRNDPVFHAVVNSIQSMITQHGITPSELREAVFLAHYKHEIENPEAIEVSVKSRMQQVYGDKLR